MKKGILLIIICLLGCSTAELVDRADIIFHLAAAVGVRLIVESPVNTIETNVHGTETVLKLANSHLDRVCPPSVS